MSRRRVVTPCQDRQGSPPLEPRTRFCWTRRAALMVCGWIEPQSSPPRTSFDLFARVGVALLQGQLERERVRTRSQRPPRRAPGRTRALRERRTGRRNDVGVVPWLRRRGSPRCSRWCSCGLEIADACRARRGGAAPPVEPGVAHAPEIEVAVAEGRSGPPTRPAEAPLPSPPPMSGAVGPARWGSRRSSAVIGQLRSRPSSPRVMQAERVVRRVRVVNPVCSTFDTVQPLPMAR
jgi:hypothetical protein